MVVVSVLVVTVAVVAIVVCAHDRVAAVGAARVTGGVVIVLAIIVVATTVIAAGASDAAAASASAWAQRKCCGAQRYPIVAEVHLHLLLLLPSALLPLPPYRATARHAAPHLAAQFFGKPRSLARLAPCQLGSCASCDVAWLCAAPRCWRWRACWTRAALPFHAMPRSIALLCAFWARQVRVPASLEAADSVLWTNFGFENSVPKPWKYGKPARPG